MENKAWFCPSCQSHHAPHVQTCPRVGYSDTYPYTTLSYPIMNCCCSSETCRREGCQVQRRTRGAYSYDQFMTGAS